MTDTNPVVWGGLYRVCHNRWNNDQSYGLAIPAKGKDGDTYMVDTHMLRSGFAHTDDAIRHILAAEDPEKGRFIVDRMYDFYHHNVEPVFYEKDLGDDYRLLGDLHDYRSLAVGEHPDEYLPKDVITHVRLYQDHGYPHGVPLVRKDARRDPNRVVMHEVSQVRPEGPDPCRYEAARLCEDMRYALPDDITYDTALSLVETLRKVQVARSLKEDWDALCNGMSATRGEHARARCRERFDAIPAPEVTLGDIDGMADYLATGCYCPNEIYDAGGFYYHHFPPTCPTKRLGDSDDGTRFMVAALDQNGTTLQLIIFARDGDGKVANATRADLTEHNTDAMTTYVRTGESTGVEFDEYVDDEPATRELLDEARRLFDEIDPDEG